MVVRLLVSALTEAVLLLSGGAQMEDLDESVIESLEQLRSHPVSINSCGRSRLLSCGLFSSYQVVSLLEYRQRFGDVMSLTELAAVDGFGEEYAKALSEFIRLGGNVNPGRRGLRQSLLLSGTARSDIPRPGSGVLTSGESMTAESSGEGDTEPEMEACAGTKYQASWGDVLELNYCGRNTYSDRQFGPGTFNAAVYGKKWLGKAVAGDYNLRLGQGLLVWTGFSFSGVSTPQSLSRNSTGVSPSRSYSSACRGLAVDFNLGQWTLACAYDLPGTGIVNVGTIRKNWQAGITGLMENGRMATSADWRFGNAGFSFFGEVAAEQTTQMTTQSASSSSKSTLDQSVPVATVKRTVKRAVAAVAGVLWVPKYGTTVSVAARIYPKSFSGKTSGAVRSASKVSDEHGASLGFQNAFSLLTFDTSWKPSKNTMKYKLISRLNPSFLFGEWNVMPSFRFSERLSLDSSREREWRTDLRADMGLTRGRLSLNCRANWLHCSQWAWMYYAEAGWKGRMTLWLRGGMFRVDDWNDRIYVYERDAPGNFNMPVCYGRGWNASVVAGLKLGRCHSFWLRGSVVDYPWMSEKPGRWEARVQYNLSLSSFNLRLRT